MSSRNIRVGIALLGYLFVSISEIHAQSFEEYKRQALSDFNNYKKQQQRDFKEYRDRVNAEFAEYMRRAWPQFDAQPAEPVPDRPEPPRPAVKDPNAGPSNDPIPFDNVIPSPDPVRPPLISRSSPNALHGATGCVFATGVTCVWSNVWQPLFFQIRNGTKLVCCKCIF